MRFRFTCNSDDKAGPLLGAVGLAFEEQLNPPFADRSYGANIGLVMVIAVAVEPDPEANAWYWKHDYLGSHTDMLTDKRERLLCLMLPFNPEEIARMSMPRIRTAWAKSLLARLDAPVARLPKGFDYAAFVADLKTALGSGVRKASSPKRAAR